VIPVPVQVYLVASSMKIVNTERRRRRSLAVDADYIHCSGSGWASQYTNMYHTKLHQCLITHAHRHGQTKITLVSLSVMACRLDSLHGKMLPFRQPLLLARVNKVSK